MNTNPSFTDHLGRPFNSSRKQRELKPWQRLLFAFLIVGVAPLVVMGAITQINLSSQVSGLLPAANGGLGANASAFTGILRDASGTASASEISGDCATSGSNVLTCTKINSTTVPTNSAANQALITTGSATGAWATLADTSAGGLAETYNATTHAFGTISTGIPAFYQEVPSGTVNGSNTSFTLAHTPTGATSVMLYENGGCPNAGRLSRLYDFRCDDYL